MTRTRTTRTGRRAVAGGGVLQLGRLAQLGDHAATGCGAWGVRGACGSDVLAVSLPIQPRKEPWNEPSRPVAENDAIPIGPPQQAVLNTDETVAICADVRRYMRMADVAECSRMRLRFAWK